MSGHHHHIDPDSGDRKVIAAIAVNGLLTIAQIVGGILSGSLALIADALHNFSDAVSLVIAFAARKIARRPSDEAMTFGYGRVEVVAALVNYTTLIVMGLYLLFEATMRFINPQPVTGWLMIAVAGVALLVDLVTALLTYTMSKTSVNIRAAFLHNVADALGSVAVIGAGTLIMLYGWQLVDPIVTALIAGYILYMSVTQIGPVIRILMLGSPPEIDGREIIEHIRSADGVESVHHVHFWQMEEHASALDAHLVIKKGCWNQADEIKALVKRLLAEKFDINHATLETECSVHICHNAETIGHGAPSARQ